MNRLFLALAISILATASAAWPQDMKPQEPEYLSVFYFLNASGQLVDLERQIPDATDKPGAWLSTIPGEKSPVRLPVTEKLQFVVRVAEDLQKASKTVQLFQFEARNGQREFQARKSALMSNKASLRVLTKKYGESSLKIVPSGTLAPGEYCISRTTIRQGYCFGVDTPPSR